MYDCAANLLVIHWIRTNSNRCWRDSFRTVMQAVLVRNWLMKMDAVTLNKMV
jgi:hypothetical protein